MKKSDLQNLLTDLEKFDLNSHQLVSEKMRNRFTQYFSKTPQQSCNEKVISDESLFRDYSRLGNRKVDFDRIRNPFNLSKFLISTYEKTWFIQGKDKEIQGPYNCYEMDNMFKKNKITKQTKIGINKYEFFRFDYFVEIVYPLPRSNNNNHQGNKIKNVTFMPSVLKITHVEDDIMKSTAKKENHQNTPFKRTPFKNVPKNGVGNNDQISVDQTQWKGIWTTSKKPNQQNVQMVNETFLVKSRNKTESKAFQRSNKIEMNDILGNYTAIKKDTDKRQYVDLSKKIDFQKDEQKQDDKEDEEIKKIKDKDVDEFDFDNLDVGEN